MPTPRFLFQLEAIVNFNAMFRGNEGGVFLGCSEAARKLQRVRGREVVHELQHVIRRARGPGQDVAQQRNNVRREPERDGSMVILSPEPTEAIDKDKSGPGGIL